MSKLTQLKKCKLMEEMERTSQRMPGIFKKISNFWILCQMDKKVGENY